LALHRLIIRTHRVQKWKDANSAELREAFDELQWRLVGEDFADHDHLRETFEELLAEFLANYFYRGVFTDPADFDCEVAFIIQEALAVGLDVLSIAVDDFGDEFAGRRVLLDLVFQQMRLQYNADIVLFFIFLENLFNLALRKLVLKTRG